MDCAILVSPLFGRNEDLAEMVVELPGTVTHNGARTMFRRRDRAQGVSLISEKIEAGPDKGIIIYRGDSVLSDSPIPQKSYGVIA